ncbi:hypothetical protein TNIN_129471 [Trichonephila inaurata madagascariensis]|uniref:Uncharacterized protein n=1 Tax=Trichonephila inaurata madagascariensis TaxID=2747483 RepID=A0A8X7CHR0_9ARAC|nr:hypothetical protein TNIN_129471 [Trichonephila inaurata madagascariensis]
MANLPTDMELEQVTMQRNSSRTPSPQPSTCEQLKYNKAQLAKMERSEMQQTCANHSDKCPPLPPEEPFLYKSTHELQEKKKPGP